MENTNLVRYWEAKYKKLQTITLVSTFVGTLLGLTIGNYCCKKSDYKDNTDSTTLKKTERKNQEYKY